MTTVLLIVHLFLAIALVAVVLVQRSEGGALGIGGGGGGGGGGLGGLMSSRGTANFLTRTTAILAGAFMVTSLALALLSDSGGQRSIVDEVERTAPTAPAETPAPAAPATPSVPLSK